jgi:hypothetical protein
MTAQPRGPGILFHLTAGAATLFVLTVLAMLTTALAEPGSPLDRWLNRYGIALILGEVALIAIGAWMAMWRDQHTAGRKEKPHT